MLSKPRIVDATKICTAPANSTRVCTEVCPYAVAALPFRPICSLILPCFYLYRLGYLPTDCPAGSLNTIGSWDPVAAGEIIPEKSSGVKKPGRGTDRFHQSMEDSALLPVPHRLPAQNNVYYYASCIIRASRTCQNPTRKKKTEHHP